MAADVIESPKFSLREKTPDINSGSKISGPFRATQLWNDVISQLRSRVEVKRRRLKMRSYEQCFTGADAVDVVLAHLLEDRASFTKDICREKAIKLCQLMQASHVFEPVTVRIGDGNDHRATFEDSSTKLYRFPKNMKNPFADGADICEHVCSLGSAETPCSKFRMNEDLEPELISRDDVIGNPVVLKKQGQIVEEIMNITGAWKRYSTECLKRKITPARVFPKRLSLPNTGSAKAKHLPKTVAPAVEEEIWREVALSQLLTVVEIPMLDNILSYDKVVQKPRKKELAFSNLAFKRWESVTSVFSERPEDQWLDAAMDCLECLPNGHDVLDSSLTEETDLTQKLRLYQALADHYRSLSEPLWSSKFIDLHLGLLNMMMRGEDSSLLKAVQLSLILLPNALREEICRLLRFIQVASEEDAVQLSSMENNIQVLEKSFTSAIIKNKMLAPRQAAQLVKFMTAHAERLHDYPDEVEDMVLGRLRQLSAGMVQHKLEKTYCNQVTEDEFRKQQIDFTEKAIVDLVNTILDDTKMSLKEKKQRLKQLQKHHPQIYQRYFSDIH